MLFFIMFTFCMILFLVCPRAVISLFVILFVFATEYNYVDNPFVSGRLEHNSDDMMIEGTFGSSFETVGISIAVRCCETYHTPAFYVAFKTSSIANKYTSSLEGSSFSK